MANTSPVNTTTVFSPKITIEAKNIKPYDWEADDPFGSFTPERLGGKLKEYVNVYEKTYQPKYLKNKDKPLS
jgi:hypothetical protein